MRKHRSLTAVALLIASLPLMGETCTEKKLVELVIGFPTKATFQAEGVINNHNETSTVTKADIDIEGELEKAGIDPNERDSNGDLVLNPDDLAVSRVFYKCKVADPRSDRKIVGGSLTVVELDSAGNPTGGPPVVFVTGWTGDFGAVTDFIEITNLIEQAGIDLLNQFLRDCLRDLQSPAPSPAAGPTPPIAFQYTVSGQSTPMDVPTSFQWELLVQFQSIVKQEFDIPF